MRESSSSRISQPERQPKSPSIDARASRLIRDLIKKQEKQKPRSLLSFRRRSSFARSIASVRKAASSTLVERRRRSATYCPIQESATLCVRKKRSGRRPLQGTMDFNPRTQESISGLRFTSIA